MLELDINTKREILANLSIENLCRFSQVSKVCLELVNGAWKFIFQKRWPHIKVDTEDSKTLKERVIVITLLERYDKKSLGVLDSFYNVTNYRLMRTKEHVFTHEANFKIYHEHNGKKTPLAIQDDMMKFTGWKTTKCAVYKNVFYVYLPEHNHIRSWNFIDYTQHQIWSFSSRLFSEID